MKLKDKYQLTLLNLVKHRRNFVKSIKLKLNLLYILNYMQSKIMESL